jgi:endogenous inhibitor of DNA gyrase (YacG/DUF329 family)
MDHMRRRCPTCRKVISAAIQEQSRLEKFYPFCSNRCKLIDLGQWLDGKYKIVSKLRPEDSEQTGDVSANERDKDEIENAGQSQSDGG